jgi:hypothetical protein
MTLAVYQLLQRPQGSATPSARRCATPTHAAWRRPGAASNRAGRGPVPIGAQFGEAAPAAAAAAAAAAASPWPSLDVPSSSSDGADGPWAAGAWSAPPLPRATKEKFIVVLRHGASTWNEAGRIQAGGSVMSQGMQYHAPHVQQAARNDRQPRLA